MMQRKRLSPSAPEGTTEGPSDGNGPPLEGVVVADFSRILAGPLCTMVLADLGATVIKVEHPERGDDTRHWGPPFVADGLSSYYVSVNRNKKSVSLDLKDPIDRRRALALAEHADVVVENFRAETMDRFGLSYDDVSAVNSGVIYCTISGFGPNTTLPGYDFLVQAASGLMSITGESGGRPLKAGVAIVDVVAGLNSVIGILAALQARNRTGQGQQVHVDLMTSALLSLVNQASTFLTTGEVPHRMGNRHPNIAPYESFSTATDSIAIAAANDTQFLQLCHALDRSELPSDERFLSNAARVENREELVELLQAALNTKPSQVWLDVLTEAGVPCAPINDIAGAFSLAESLGLQPTADLDGLVTTANPIHLSGNGAAYVSPPPELGEHTAEVLEWLDTLVGEPAE